MAPAQSPALPQRIAAYNQWKARLVHAIDELGTWLEENRRSTPKARAQLGAARRLLESDRLRIAIVSGSSRGSGDLANAIFFPELGGRVLPKSLGSGGRCPLELVWDHGRDESYLRLLPVESRAVAFPFAALKADPRYWVHYPLDYGVPEQMSALMNEIVQTKTISGAEARRLGLSSAEAAAAAEAPAKVQVPKWRYAVASLPHPLLKLGLSIVVVPSAAALDQDPELATEALPAAQALLFVLAADLGVEAEDLRIWQQGLKGFGSARQRPVLVVLDKTDRLWGEAGGEAAVATARREAAESLGVGEELVVGVSAQLGLAAKLGRDDALLRRSGLPALERQLASRLIYSKRRQLTESIDTVLGGLVERNRTRVALRMARIEAELDEIEVLRGRSQSSTAQMVEQARGDHDRYLRAIEVYGEVRAGLLAETAACRQILDASAVAARFGQAHRDLGRCSTTLGLSRALATLFEDLQRTVEKVADESERIRKRVREIYRVFAEDLGLECAPPKVFLPMSHRVEIELLIQELDAFRRGPGFALRTKAGAVRQFDQQIGTRARVLFDQLRNAIDEWTREALLPLAGAIEGLKDRTERQLEAVQDEARSRDTLERRVEDMKSQQLAVAQALAALSNIQDALHQEPPLDLDRGLPRRPRLVSAR